MKRQYIIFALVLVVLISCKKDEETEPIGLPLVSWEVKEVDVNYSGPYSDYLFLNEKNFFFLSNSLLKSTDGGRNFSQLTGNLTSVNRRELAVLDENHIWVALDSLDEVNREVVTNFLRSTDSGENWEKWTVRNIRLDEISFISPTKGFAFGVQFIPGQNEGINQLFETKDSGKTWLNVEEVELKTNLSKIVWENSNTGYLVDLSAPIYITEDAGETWGFLGRIAEPTDVFNYAINENQFFVFRNNETLRLDRLTGKIQKVADHPLQIISHRGDDLLGVLLFDACMIVSPCTRRWVTSNDSGRTWSKKIIAPYEIGYNFSSQQLGPGKAVFLTPSFTSPLIFVTKR